MQSVDGEIDSIWINDPLDTILVISKIIFPAKHFTGGSKQNQTNYNINSINDTYKQLHVLTYSSKTKHKYASYPDSCISPHADRHH